MDQLSEQPQVLDQVAMKQKMLQNTLPRLFTHTLRPFLLRESLADQAAEACEVARVVEQETSAPVLDLIQDAADGAGNHRTGLPHGLGHGQPEAFLQALLNDDGGMSLQRVDN